jgi:electron transport complex protein RnfD
MVDKAREYSGITKDSLMAYTFIALLILAAVSSLAWGPTSVILSAIAAVTAVGLDYLISKIPKAKMPRNTLSAAVFGLIVALSYTLAVATPTSWVFTIHLSAVHIPELLPLQAPQAYAYVAAISGVGLVVFKKAQGLLGRKYVNPAAAAKLVVLLPFLGQVLLPAAHPESISLTGPINYGANASFTGPNVLYNYFGPLVQACLGNTPNFSFRGVSPTDVFNTMFFMKYHSWVGGASSLAVILVGIGFFLVARRYVKWRITACYLLAVAAMSVLMYGVYGGDVLLRIEFELFIGSSVFLAFFMATDPATTPLTYRGQAIFGVGLGVLTVLIQMYMNFLGGSILALIIMNLSSPLLDKIGLQKPSETKIEKKMPKGKQFLSIKTTQCIRCGACIRACCHNLSPILIKEAYDKGKKQALASFRVKLCDGCGHCSYVCPSRIDLKGTVLRAKVSENSLT